ncbi:eukaryotic translation initiation factor 2-alpha kinase 1 isoform X3 [Boleophthalmus pectinirostris]|uniref:eukaryotic translation initiation factor 2-alpha kinase 1 isoform X3 n=1 Tax=Boleophthalmus pectinirostris TaxID=150288 RepID=UPI00242CA89C|nr:eukaryotic translation initiation factor 2-alpha kinase 1 isoform X3 [Boleophthalmus pectinirostris]
MVISVLFKSSLPYVEMNCSTSGSSGALQPEEGSGSGSELLLQPRLLRPIMGEEVESTLGLISSASEEDDDIQFDTSDMDNDREVLMAGRSYSSIQEFASAIPNHLLLGSLLEHLCLVYENNPARSRMLFKVIGQRLAAMNLLSPLAISDEFSTVRLQHNRAFTELLHAASSSLYPQVITLHGDVVSYVQSQRLGTNTRSSTVKPIEGLFQAQTSRYLSEFEEICKLGKGSYGNVFKVLNKLDGQYYAVKKILIKKVSKEDCMKVLREVKVLSSLQHVNVVGYHTAWMEHVQPAAYPQSSLPALESPEQCDSSDENLNDNSTGSSIVFQSLSQELSVALSDQVHSANGAAEPLVSSPVKNQVLCTKPKHRLPENYVPCVFLGQRSPIKDSKCPAMGLDSSIVFEEGSSSNNELSNGSCSGKECQQRVGKCAKTIKEVQFHLMLYIQMQLCERSLKDWISERNAEPKLQPSIECPYARVDTEHTLNILKSILDGVEYIHSRGIMHRDLKPRNIFLHGHDCHVRIGDFGLACGDLIVDGRKSSGSPCSDSSHTTGVGTFVYASPEQLKGSHYDSKSDMYSVGMLAFELFQPFGTEMERVRCLGDLREGKIPDTFCNRWPILAKHIMKLTNQDPSVRPTATELLQSELFSNKDEMIHGLQKQVEEQEKEIMQLRRRISELECSNVSLSESNET